MSNFEEDNESLYSCNCDEPDYDDPEGRRNIEYYKSAQHKKKRHRHKRRKTHRVNDHRRGKKAYGLVTLNCSQINRMIILSYAINGLHFLYDMFLIHLGHQTFENCADSMNLVTWHDGTYIAFFIYFTGIFSALINLSFLLIDKRSSKKVRSELINSLHFVCITATLILIVFLIACSIFIFTHTTNALKDRKNKGILDAMMTYKANLKSKIMIDKMQIQFQCCGCRKYSEWFDIAWYDTNIISKRGKDCRATPSSTHDDTPFSCCNRNTPFLCIHNSVMEVGSAYLYAPEANFSVSEHGCHNVVMHWSETFSLKSALLLLMFALMQTAIVILQRYLQTAHQENCRFVRGEYNHKGWLFGTYEAKRKSGPRLPPVPDDW